MIAKWDGVHIINAIWLNIIRQWNGRSAIFFKISLRVSKIWIWVCFSMNFKFKWIKLWDWQWHKNTNDNLVLGWVYFNQGLAILSVIITPTPFYVCFSFSTSYFCFHWENAINLFIQQFIHAKFVTWRDSCIKNNIPIKKKFLHFIPFFFFYLT